MKRLAPPEDLEELQNFFRASDYVGAYQATLEKNSCVNNVVRAGLINVGDGKNATEEGMRTALGHEHTRIMTRISYLSVIGVCTPMVGLVGTVTGFHAAFLGHYYLVAGGQVVLQRLGQIGHLAGPVLQHDGLAQIVP